MAQLAYITRITLARTYPVFFAAAAVVAGFDIWSPLSLGGIVVVLMGLGFTGANTGAIESTHTQAIDLLLRALLDGEPKPEPAPACHRVAS